MALPVTREEFKEHCLRDLGKPVIDINVDDAQVEDRIDEALQYFRDYHYDGSARIWYKHQVTQEDIDNEYFTLPDTIFGVAKVLPILSVLTGQGWWNINYQYVLNNIDDLTSPSLSYFYTSQMKINEISTILSGLPQIKFNRHKNQLTVDVSKEKFVVGNYIVLDAWEYVDPDVYTDVWKDRWLTRYTSELIKKQWGSNLKKFEGLALPGGVNFNGQKIYDEAVEAINILEEKMLSDFSIPVEDDIG